MSKVWYISIQGLFCGIWYFATSAKSEVDKNKAILKLTSLEWVSAYIAFTYFFLSLLLTFHSSIVKPKLRVSLYLLMVSLLGFSFLVTLLLYFIKRPDEYEEFVLDINTILTGFITHGGLLVLSLIEKRNIKDFDYPKWSILVIFDIYLVGWYCFVQFMCHKVTGSYSYAFLNTFPPDMLIFSGIAMLGGILLIKYIIIGNSPRPKVQSKEQGQVKKNN